MSVTPPTGSARSARSRLFLLVVLLLMLTAAPVGAQEVQEQEQDVPPIRLTLSRIDAVVRADGVDQGALELEVQAGPADRTDLRAVTTLYSRVATSQELSSALAGDPQAPFASQSQTLDDLPAGVSQIIEVSLDPVALELTGEERQGVYPLEIGLFESGDPVGTVSTALVLLPPGQLAGRLPTGAVVEVSASTLPMARDQAMPDLEELLAPGAPLLAGVRALARSAEDGSAAGLTLALSGRLLNDLADVANGHIDSIGVTQDTTSRPARRAQRVIEELRALLRRADTGAVALPYGPADLVALVRGGEPDEAVRLVDIGKQVVRQVTGTEALPDVLVPPDGIDAMTVAALGATQPSLLLLQERYLAFADDDQLQPLRRLRTADGGEVRILMPDEHLSDLLQDPREIGSAAVAQRVLAETALAWFGEDDQATGVLLRAEIPGEVTPEVLTRVLDAVGGAPWLRPVSLQTLADRLSPASRLVRLAYPPSSRAAELDAEYIAQLGEARDALVPLRALLPPTQDVASRFGRSLLVAAALPYRPPSARPAGEARIAEVLEALQDLTRAVDVLEGPPITLTSATGEVPISLQNTSTVPLSLRVQVGSTGFEFDSDTQELVLPPESVQTLTFRARARNPGAISGVGVSVTDPSGRLTLVSATLAVRSTAFPVVAVVALVGGIVALLVWGTRQGRRRRQAAVTPARDTESVA